MLRLQYHDIDGSVRHDMQMLPTVHQHANAPTHHDHAHADGFSDECTSKSYTIGQQIRCFLGTYIWLTWIHLLVDRVLIYPSRKPTESESWLILKFLNISKESHS